MSDKINPSHYDGDACMQKIADLTAGLSGSDAFCAGQCIKYLWRAGRKDGESFADDRTKARWYLDWMTARECSPDYISPTLLHELRAIICDGSPHDMLARIQALSLPKSQMRSLRT